MIGDDCGVCGRPIREGDVELRVPHPSRPDTSIHAICPPRKEGTA